MNKRGTWAKIDHEVEPPKNPKIIVKNMLGGNSLP